MRSYAARSGSIPSLFLILTVPVWAGTEDGSCLEAWELLNYQTKSPTNGQLVKSSSYLDRPTVVMLLSSG